MRSAPCSAGSLPSAPRAKTPTEWTPPGHRPQASHAPRAHPLRPAALRRGLNAAGHAPPRRPTDARGWRRARARHASGCAQAHHAASVRRGMIGGFCPGCRPRRGLAARPERGPADLPQRPTPAAAPHAHAHTPYPISPAFLRSLSGFPGARSGRRPRADWLPAGRVSGDCPRALARLERRRVAHGFSSSRHPSFMSGMIAARGPTQRACGAKIFAVKAGQDTPNSGEECVCVAT